MSHQRIVFALDANPYESQRLIDILEPHVGLFKFGLELFIDSASTKLPKTSKPIVLDLKLHDIPETVERAVAAAARLGARYATLHVQQRSTLERAAKKAEEVGIKLLAVTVLTSMNEKDCDDLRYSTTSPGDRVRYLARFARGCGITGFVCSPQDVGQLRLDIPDGFFMVPGVRPTGADLGDQKRVGTPAQTVKDGADLIVVGRPIRDAADPVAAAQAIAAEIEGC